VEGDAESTRLYGTDDTKVCDHRGKDNQHTGQVCHHLHIGDGELCLEVDIVVSDLDVLFGERKGSEPIAIGGQCGLKWLDLHTKRPRVVHHCSHIQIGLASVLGVQVDGHQSGVLQLQRRVVHHVLGHRWTDDENSDGNGDDQQDDEDREHDATCLGTGLHFGNLVLPKG